MVINNNLFGKEGYGVFFLIDLGGGVGSLFGGGGERF